MKILSLLLLVTTIALVGCNKSDDASGGAAKTNATPPTPPK
jgi:hypothetical protein